MSNEPIRSIFETAHFRVAPCSDCSVPGYLILVPKVPVRSFSEMAPAALENLGVALGRACSAMEAVIKPEGIYVARFSEGSADIHFHLFPRTARLLQAYLKERGDEQAPVSGPLILDWARKRYPMDTADHSEEEGQARYGMWLDAATALREWEKTNRPRCRCTFSTDC